MIHKRSRNLFPALFAWKKKKIRTFRPEKKNFALFARRKKKRTFRSEKQNFGLSTHGPTGPRAHEPEQPNVEPGEHRLTWAHGLTGPMGPWLASLGPWAQSLKAWAHGLGVFPCAAGRCAHGLGKWALGQLLGCPWALHMSQ